MISLRLRCTVAAVALMAAAPASHAWTRISCNLGGTAASPPMQMRQFRIDGTEISQLMFRLRVRSAEIPEGARADTDCTEFMGREIDVVLDGAGATAVRKGQSVKLRYRYDDSLGEARASRFELVR
ncbi:hypothetical protein A6B37_09665 [Achromobacter sp. HZ01]|jgi:hypothetical protein|uniref:Uncharacterized protein n=1 Tax=Achromobacter pulmonis TaxID=1389932 RepID=A0A2N8KGE8_9BURK|nr:MULTISPECIES: hypothetical protein [Achromobacter]MBO9330281.1 hypothetical protein [Achromobacter xylosoxidans]PND32526.1 hypothetical protein C1I89_15755 [Achromobacter pulmonis]RAP62742.1 hypothetical protein A6B37_09665 [Achromobacter sp. HZ01]